MQAKTKQRILGVLVLLAIVSISLPFLFNHTWPTASKATLSERAPEPPETPSYVYDLPLAGQAKKVRGDDPDNELNYETTEKLRARASQTALVSSHILRTSKPSLKINSNQCVKSCTSSSTAKAYLKEKEFRAAAEVDTSRDSGLKEVSFLKSKVASSTSWVVQVASFSEPNRAEHLQSALKGLGLKTFARTVINSAGSTIVRVFVGPYPDKNKAQQLQKELEAKIHLRGMVKKYT